MTESEARGAESQRDKSLTRGGRESVRERHSERNPEIDSERETERVRVGQGEREIENEQQDLRDGG